MHRGVKAIMEGERRKMTCLQAVSQGNASAAEVGRWERAGSGVWAPWGPDSAGVKTRMSSPLPPSLGSCLGRGMLWPPASRVSLVMF